MNIAPARPRIWTPQVILFSILVHIGVLYYVAVAFNVIPPPAPPVEPKTIRTVRFDPPPPPPPNADPIIEKRPMIQQRQPDRPPVQPLVQPTPFEPVTAPAITGTPTIDLRQPIPEQPVSQLLPNYPRAAQEREIEGRVVLSVTIMPDGSVRDVRVVSARPSGYFENAAVSAVQRWRYKPSNVIRTNVIVDIDFVLR
jgi:protein TonB